MSFMQCLAEFTNQTKSQVEDIHESTSVVFGNERQFHAKFGFGYRIITKTEPIATGKYKPRCSVKIVHRSLFDKFILLQYVTSQWPEEKEVIHEYDKFVLLPTDTVPIHECRFGCEYSSKRRRDVERHESTCSMETVMRTKQVCLTDPDARDWLVKNNFIGRSSIIKEFCTYDIETLLIPSSNSVKGHKCIIIAIAKNFGSEPRSRVIKRASLDEVGYDAMLDEFYKTVREFQREFLEQPIPKEYRDALLKIYEKYQQLREKTITVHPRYRAGMYQAKKYLEKIIKMKVFGYNSERFDMPVIFPGFVKLLSKNGEVIDAIKSGSGFMQVTTSDTTYMDVMRFVAGGSLDKFAKTWGAEAVKGIFPYELFRNVDALRACRTWPKIEHFFSSLNMNKRNVQHITQKLNEAWRLVVENPRSALLKQVFRNRLCLEKYFDNVPKDLPDTYNYDQLVFSEGKDENSIPVDPVLYVQNWIDFENKIQTGECQSMLDFYATYCAKDALILAQAFSNYCDSFVKHHSVNPLDSPSLPSMASQILWKNYNQTVNKPYSFGADWTFLNREIRKNIMGGLSMVFCRHAEVNTPRIYNDIVHTVPNGEIVRKIECVDFNSKFYSTNSINKLFRFIWKGNVKFFTDWCWVFLRAARQWIILMAFTSPKNPRMELGCDILAELFARQR